MINLVTPIIIAMIIRRMRMISLIITIIKMVLMMKTMLMIIIVIIGSTIAAKTKTKPIITIEMFIIMVMISIYQR